MGVHVFPILNPTLHLIPLGHPSAPALSTVSCIEPGLAICFTYDNIHVSMLFSQIIPPLLSPTESKSLFFTSVSLLLSLIQCYSYYLSKFYIYVLLLLVSHFSRVRLCATPETVTNQAPPSLELSRQEHWSGLPFPSPMHESEK